MKNLKLCSAILLLCFSTAVAQADETVSIKAGYASLTATGNVSAGPAGTVLSDTALGLDRSNNVTAELALQLGDGRLSIGYLPLKFTGTSTQAGTVFNGQTFNGAVTSELKADLIDVGYTYYLVNMDDLPSRLQLGIEVAVKYFQVGATLTNAGGTQTASANVPLPTIGVRGRVALADFIGINGRIGYIGYNGNRFMDVDAQIEFSPLPTLGVYGGYRHMDVKVDSSGVVVDAKFAGPYVGAFFRF